MSFPAYNQGPQNHFSTYMESTYLNDASPGAPMLRPVEPADQAFLYDLYVQVQEPVLDLSHLEPAQSRSLLQLQFTAQQQHYKSQYPDAEHSIVLIDNMPIGQIYVARTAGQIHLIDISILPRFQNRGIGTYLLGMLQAEATATARPIHLSVLLSNRQALQLYQRLGFTIISSTALHLSLRWQPSGAAARANFDASG